MHTVLCFRNFNLASTVDEIEGFFFDYKKIFPVVTKTFEGVRNSLSCWKLPLILSYLDCVKSIKDCDMHGWIQLPNAHESGLNFDIFTAIALFTSLKVSRRRDDIAHCTVKVIYGNIKLCKWFSIGWRRLREVHSASHGSCAFWKIARVHDNHW